MGRMFRIITESGRDTPRHPGDPATASGPTLAVEVVPFVEVGGPDGVVTSIPLPTPRPPAPVVVPVPVPVPESEAAADPEPVIVPERAAAPEPKVLSVAFHTFPRTGLRLLPTEVAPELVAYHHPDHPVCAEYRAVRDEILRQFEEPHPRAALFTSAAPVSGTTTVVLNVAASLAHDTGARVLVVDANLTRPAVARRLAVADAPGLAEVLGQTVPLAWALQPTTVENLQVLTAGHPTAATAAAMASDFPRLVAQVRQWFDWVLVDGGVWGDGIGREGVVAGCDAVFAVTRQHDIDRPEFAALRASVGSAGGLLRGYVTTRQ